MPGTSIDDFLFSRDPVNPNLATIKDRLRDYRVGNLNLSNLAINDDDLMGILMYLKKNKIKISSNFYLSRNDFTTLSTGLFNEVVVKEDFFLSNNPALTTIDEGAFQGCYIGVSLYIYSNLALTTISKGAFQGCSIRGNLYLSGNPALTTISQGAFQDCSIRWNLDLSGNPALTTISQGAFQDCSIRWNLCLSSNPALASIPLSAFENASIARMQRNDHSKILDSENQVVSQQDFISFLATEREKFSMWLVRTTPLAHILLSPEISFPLIRPHLLAEREAFIRDLQRIYYLMPLIFKQVDLPLLPLEILNYIFSFITMMPIKFAHWRLSVEAFLNTPLQKIQDFSTVEEAAPFCDQFRKDMQTSRNTGKKPPPESRGSRTVL